jgi:hypothetical protein
LVRVVEDFFAVFFDALRARYWYQADVIDA